MALLVIGGTVVDVILPDTQKLPAWPAHTEFTAANLVLLQRPPLVTIGGNGANAAYVAARCGAAVTLRTRIGQDVLGGLARRWLENAGCAVVGERAAGLATALNVTAANARQQRATFFYTGPAPRLPSRLVSAAGAAVSHVLVCGWPHPPAERLIRRARAWRRAGVRVAWDAGPLLGEEPRGEEIGPLLGELDLLLGNEHEWRTLSGARTLAGAVAWVRRHSGADLVIKRGPRGAWWVPHGQTRPLVVRPRQVRAVNTVGAGDAFNGGLLAGLVAGQAMPTALATATRVAARAVASRRGIAGL
jgi:ribokinase